MAPVFACPNAAAAPSSSTRNILAPDATTRAHFDVIAAAFLVIDVWPARADRRVKPNPPRPLARITVRERQDLGRAGDSWIGLASAGHQGAAPGTEFCGGQPGQAAEDASHVALVAETGIHGDLDDWLIGGDKLAARPLDAKRADVIADRHALPAAEVARQVNRMYLSGFGDLPQRDDVPELRLQKLDCAFEPARPVRPWEARPRDLGDELERNRLDTEGGDPILAPQLAMQARAELKQVATVGRHTGVESAAARLESLDPGLREFEVQEVATGRVDAVRVGLASAVHNHITLADIERAAQALLRVGAAKHERDV